MVCSDNSYRGQRYNNLDWQNWSNRVRKKLDALFMLSPSANAAIPPPPLLPPLGLPQVTRVAQDATAANKSLHAIGSGWSIEDAAVGDHWTIDIQGLGARLMGVVGEALVEKSPPGLVAYGAGLTDEWRQRQADRTGSRKLVHIEAGVKLWQLITMLDTVGLALPTLGGANGQSLAGVINTSVHGGDWNQPAFPGVVRSIHLVTRGGQEMTWTPKAEPALMRASPPARLGQEKPHETQTPHPRADHPQAAHR